MESARGPFPTTRLSAIVGAGSPEESERRRSWEALVAAYWKPAYKHVRMKWKKTREDAADAVQAFFERAMERDFFVAYEPERGRFRTFFRVCLDRHVSNANRAEGREKRGGGAAALSLDFDAAEDELDKSGAASAGSPEDVFDREWRRSVFALAIEALERECAANGKQACFTAFARYDLADTDDRPTYDALARELGVPVTTITNHLAFARRELRRLVLAKLAEITTSDGELEAEAKLLLGSAS